MRAFLALMRRETIEHRGAFIYAPLVLIALLFVFLGGGLVTGRFENIFLEIATEYGADATTTAQARTAALAAFAVYAGKVFEFGFLIFALGWLAYFVMLIFFYSADAYAADRRNNSMLFWKSMPVSDLKILMSKFTTATVLVPLIGFAAMLVTGLILAVLSAATRESPAGFMAILGEVLPSYPQVAGTALASTVAVVVWYLPFFAWVGALSAIVGRWSIPLAFLIPSLLGLIENLVVPDTARGGTVFGYIAERLTFPSIEEGYPKEWFLSGEPINAMRFTSDLFGRLDPIQIAIGVVFSAVVLYAASEYRRRTIDN